ncbi:MAG: cation diffusion facilitator family transporter [Salibacteraceae bacterium]|jgi:cation diffusion facilitator family transporter
MSANGSKISIYGAILANLAIAISKFFAGSYTGSSAMISEGIHSLVDTSNGLLLLLGIKRSERPADKTHPFGYGMEIYFWSFVVAILIFALGGGIAIYEGIHHIISPVAVANIRVNYIVLSGAIIFEGISLFVALKEFKKDNGKFGLVKSMRRSKDSSSFTIIIEEMGAIVGLVVALIGVAVGDFFGWPYADGIASVIIGSILTGMAFFLAVETKGLLIGESMDEESLSILNKILLENEKVDQYRNMRTVHFGPTGVMVGVDIHFKANFGLMEIESEIVKIEAAIKSSLPVVRYVFIEVKHMESWVA